MTPKFDKLCDRLRRKILTEMSMRIRPMKVDPFKYINQWKVDEKSSESLGICQIFGTDIEVYLWNGDEYLRFYLFRDGDLSFFIQGFLEEENEGFSVSMCAKILGGISMENVYVDFLLTEFKYILSDSFHTEKGFGIYALLADNPKVNVSVIKQFTRETVQDDVSFSDIQKYYGDAAEYEDFIFKATRK